MFAVDGLSSVIDASIPFDVLGENNVVDKSAFFSVTCKCVPEKLISLLQGRHSNNLLSRASSNRFTGTAPGNLQWDGSHHHKQQ